MNAIRSSTTRIPRRGLCGGAARRSHSERGAAFLPMTGLVAVLFGLSAVLADQLGVANHDAESLARSAASAGATSLSAPLSGLDAAEARSRASRLATGPACRAAQSAITPAARVTACSIVDTDFIVVVVTLDAPTSTASATISLIERPTP